MKINNFGYLIKEGIRGIFLHGFMSFAAVCVTVACLLIVGSFSCLAYNFNIIVEDLNKTNEVMVYVDENLSDAQARSVGTKLNQVENIYNAIKKLPKSHIVNSKELAKEAGNARTENMVLIGTALKYVPVKEETVLSSIRERFQKKDPALVEANAKALELGAKA